MSSEAISECQIYLFFNFFVGAWLCAVSAWKTRINGSADHGIRCERGLESRPLLTALSCSITCFLMLRGKNLVQQMRRLSHRLFVVNYVIQVLIILGTQGNFKHSTCCTSIDIYYKKGNVISTSHLLYEFQVSEHTACMNSYSNPIISAFLTNCKWVKARFGWRGNCCYVFWIVNNLFTELTVHAYNMFTI